MAASKGCFLDGCFWPLILIKPPQEKMDVWPTFWANFPGHQHSILASQTCEALHQLWTLPWILLVDYVSWLFRHLIFWFILNTVSEVTLVNLPLNVQQVCDLQDTIPRHWSPATSRLNSYRQCHRYERAFFALGHFFPCNPSSFFKASWVQQFNLKVRRATCCGSKHCPGQTICLNHTALDKKFTCCRFYLRSTTG